MADFTNYPTSTDLQNLYGTTGLTLPGSVDWTTAAAAASAEWERRTGWYPYLSAGANTRYFDPPGTGPTAGRASSSRGGKQLDLDGGLVGNPTSLMIGVVPGFTGTVLELNIQYYMGPNSSHQRGLPYTYVDFLTAIRGIPKSISITGVWGRYTTLPADIWNAVLRKAAAIVAPEVGLNLTTGVIRQKEGDEERVYTTSADVSPLAAEINAGVAAFDKLARLERRILV